MKIWRRFRIPHLAADQCHVGPVRWLAYHVGCRLQSLGYLLRSWGHRLEWWAIDPDDEVPF